MHNLCRCRNTRSLRTTQRVINRSTTTLESNMEFTSIIEHARVLRIRLTGMNSDMPLLQQQHSLKLPYVHARNQLQLLTQCTTSHNCRGIFGANLFSMVISKSQYPLVIGQHDIFYKSIHVHHIISMFVPLSSGEQRYLRQEDAQRRRKQRLIEVIVCTFCQSIASRRFACRKNGLRRSESNGISVICNCHLNENWAKKCRVSKMRRT
jgi:hypothetical protein